MWFCTYLHLNTPFLPIELGYMWHRFLFSPHLQKLPEYIKKILKLGLILPQTAFYGTMLSWRPSQARTLSLLSLSYFQTEKSCSWLTMHCWSTLAAKTSFPKSVFRLTTDCLYKDKTATTEIHAVAFASVLGTYDNKEVSVHFSSAVPCSDFLTYLFIRKLISVFTEERERANLQNCKRTDTYRWPKHTVYLKHSKYTS